MAPDAETLTDSPRLAEHAREAMHTGRREPTLSLVTSRRFLDVGHGRTDSDTNVRDCWEAGPALPQERVVSHGPAHDWLGSSQGRGSMTDSKTHVLSNSTVLRDKGLFKVYIAIRGG